MSLHGTDFQYPRFFLQKSFLSPLGLNPPRLVRNKEAELVSSSYSTVPVEHSSRKCYYKETNRTKTIGWSSLGSVLPSFGHTLDHFVPVHSTPLSVCLVCFLLTKYLSASSLGSYGKNKPRWEQSQGWKGLLYLYSTSRLSSKCHWSTSRSLWILFPAGKTHDIAVPGLFLSQKDWSHFVCTCTHWSHNMEVSRFPWSLWASWSKRRRAEDIK